MFILKFLKLISFVFLTFFVIHINTHQASAATIGQQLSVPEEGWKRYDDTHEAIKYSGNFLKYSNSSYYNGTHIFTISTGDTISFSFKGTKLRLISTPGPYRDTNIQITIDDISYNYSNLNTDAAYRRLVYEIVDLKDDEHKVEIKKISNNTDFVILDAVDIDSTGVLIHPDTPTAPLNLNASLKNQDISLAWDNVLGATSYKIKRSTIPGGPYITLAENVTTTEFTDTSITSPSETFYYIVTAVNSYGESKNSNEVSMSIATNNGKGLLEITMVNGLQREYNLNSSEINQFITWYDNKSNGTGKPYFTFNKSVVGSPYISRKEYVIFDKIMVFEICEY